MIARVLELWPALVSYFTSHPDVEKRGRVKLIKDQLSDKTKLYLLFLNFLLPTVNTFNVAFQATSHSTIHLLHSEIHVKKLTKRILRYFVLVDSIDFTDITKTQFEDSSKQLDDEDLEIGECARSLSVVMTEDGMAAGVTQFLAHARIFYSTFVKKLINKFPFNSSFLLISGSSILLSVLHIGTSLMLLFVLLINSHSYS